MVVRRGTDRCMNLKCEEVAGSGFYCPECEADAVVQEKHNAALKAIGRFWASAARTLPRADLFDIAWRFRRA
jgi:hypothetical protein